MGDMLLISLRHGTGTLMIAAAAAMAASVTPASAQEPNTTAQKAQNRPGIEWMTAAQANETEVGKNVYFRGTVISVAPPRPESRAPYVVYVADATGAARVTIFQDTFTSIEDTAIFEKGANLDVFAEANEHRGTRQLVVKAPTHIRRTPGTDGTGFTPAALNPGLSAYTPITIGAVNMMTIGQPIQVTGRVSSYEPSPRERWPYKVMVQDQTGEIEAVYWDEVAESIPASDRPEQGSMIQISGIVQEYKGKLQLRVDDAAHVTRNLVAKKNRTSPQESANAGSSDQAYNN